MLGHHDVFQNGHLFEEPDILEGPRYPLLDNFVRGAGGDITVRKMDTPLRWPGQAGEAIEQGCFACTVRTDNAQNDPALDFQGELLNRLDTAKIYRKFPNV